MKLKQRLVLIVVISTIFTVLFLMGVLLDWEDEVEPAPSPRARLASVQDLQSQHQDPPRDPLLHHHQNKTIISAVRNITVLNTTVKVPRRNPWDIWREWVTAEYLYPQDAFYSEDMNSILAAMANSPITSWGLGYKGTQLKVTAMLGPQRTVFKPKRYERGHVIPGEPYAGFDKHNGEIAGFHLDGILGFRIAPPVVGRVVNLTKLVPVTSAKLYQTYFRTGQDTCFYGVCHYCRREEAVCAAGEMLEGSVTLWLPDWYTLATRKHPYQRTYIRGRRARWEVNSDYCHPLLLPSSEYYHGILEFTDSAIYDFLMGNADRHHYETYSHATPHGRLMHFDNGKTFRNPEHDELSILAPLRQCCRVRRSTWRRLRQLFGSDGPLSRVLESSLRRDPLHPILTRQQLQAMDRRHSIVMATITECISRHGNATVLVDSWPPQT